MKKRFNFKIEIRKIAINNREKQIIAMVEEKFDEFIKRLKGKLCGDLSDKNNVGGHINEGIIDKLAK